MHLSLFHSHLASNQQHACWVSFSTFINTEMSSTTSTATTINNTFIEVESSIFTPRAAHFFSTHQQAASSSSSTVSNVIQINDEEERMTKTSSAAVEIKTIDLQHKRKQKNTRGLIATRDMAANEIVCEMRGFVMCLDEDKSLFKDASPDDFQHVFVCEGGKVVIDCRVFGCNPGRWCRKMAADGSGSKGNAVVKTIVNNHITTTIVDGDDDQKGGERGNVPRFMLVCSMKVKKGDEITVGWTGINVNNPKRAQAKTQSGVNGCGCDGLETIVFDATSLSSLVQQRIKVFKGGIHQFEEEYERTVKTSPMQSQPTSREQRGTRQKRPATLSDETSQQQSTPSEMFAPAAAPASTTMAFREETQVMKRPCDEPVVKERPFEYRFRLEAIGEIELDVDGFKKYPHCSTDPIHSLRVLVKEGEDSVGVMNADLTIFTKKRIRSIAELGNFEMVCPSYGLG